MTYLHADTLGEVHKLRKAYPDFFLFCGGSDLAIRLKKHVVKGIIDISSIDELRYIDKHSEAVHIGALTTISSILEDEMIQHDLPLLTEVTKNFASHQIRNVATIGGNIANASPVADLIAPLLVLNTTVTLLSEEGGRTIPLEELFNGFHSLTLENEIIASFHIPLQEHQWYYRKVGSRSKLTITKVSLAMVKNEDGYFISGASVNPYISRFEHLEKLFNNSIFDEKMIKKALENDTDPSGSFRSTKAYRMQVLLNMIQAALSEFKR